MKETTNQKTFNPAALLNLLNDLYKTAPQVAILLAPVVADLIGLFGSTPPPLVVGKAAGCPDCCVCCDCAIAAQVHALAAMIQCKCNMEKGQKDKKA